MKKRTKKDENAQRGLYLETIIINHQNDMEAHSELQITTKLNSLTSEAPCALFCVEKAEIKIDKRLKKLLE